MKITRSGSNGDSLDVGRDQDSILAEASMRSIPQNPGGKPVSPAALMAIHREMDKQGGPANGIITASDADAGATPAPATPAPAAGEEIPAEDLSQIEAGFGADKVSAIVEKAKARLGVTAGKDEGKVSRYKADPDPGRKDDEARSKDKYFPDYQKGKDALKKLKANFALKLKKVSALLKSAGEIKDSADITGKIKVVGANIRRTLGKIASVEEDVRMKQVTYPKESDPGRAHEAKDAKDRKKGPDVNPLNKQLEKMWSLGNAGVKLAEGPAPDMGGLDMKALPLDEGKPGVPADAPKGPGEDEVDEKSVKELSKAVDDLKKADEDFATDIQNLEHAIEEMGGKVKKGKDDEKGKEDDKKGESGEPEKTPKKDPDLKPIDDDKGISKEMPLGDKGAGADNGKTVEALGVNVEEMKADPDFHFNSNAPLAQEMKRYMAYKDKAGMGASQPRSPEFSPETGYKDASAALDNAIQLLEKVGASREQMEADPNFHYDENASLFENMKRYQQSKGGQPAGTSRRDTKGYEPGAGYTEVGAAIDSASKVILALGVDPEKMKADPNFHYDESASMFENMKRYQKQQGGGGSAPAQPRSPEYTPGKGYKETGASLGKEALTDKACSKCGEQTEGGKCPKCQGKGKDDATKKAGLEAEAKKDCPKCKKACKDCKCDEKKADLTAIFTRNANKLDSFWEVKDQNGETILKASCRDIYGKKTFEKWSWVSGRDYGKLLCNTIRDKGPTYTAGVMGTKVNMTKVAKDLELEVEAKSKGGSPALQQKIQENAYYTKLYGKDYGGKMTKQYKKASLDVEKHLQMIKTSEKELTEKNELLSQAQAENEMLKTKLAESKKDLEKAKEEKKKAEEKEAGLEEDKRLRIRATKSIALANKMIDKSMIHASKKNQMIDTLMLMDDLSFQMQANLVDDVQLVAEATVNAQGKTLKLKREGGIESPQGLVQTASSQDKTLKDELDGLWSVPEGAKKAVS